MAKGNLKGSKSGDRAVPLWCQGLMEFSLLGAVFTCIFLNGVLDQETVRTICVGLMALLTLMWILHGIFLRWIPVKFSLSTLAAVAMAIYMLAVHFKDIQGEGQILLLCLPVFLAIPGAFTANQVSRLLAFFCCVGGAQAFFILLKPTLIDKNDSFVASLREGSPVTGTMGSEAELATLLVLSICATAAFALRSLLVLVPGNRSGTRFKINLIGSSGFNLALLGIMSALLSIMSLFLCQSLFPFATMAMIFLILVILLARKGILSGFLAALSIILMILLGGLDLSRPADGGLTLSAEALSGNLIRWAAGTDERINSEEINTALSEEDALPPPNVWKETVERGFWARIADRFDHTVLFMFLGLLAIFLVEGFRSLIIYKDTQPILQAGSLAGIIGAGLIGLWGDFSASQGIALILAAFFGMAVAGGEYDEEYEEVEFLS